MLPDVVKRITMLQREGFYSQADAVGGFFLQMTLNDVNHFIEYSLRMVSCNVLQGGYVGIADFRRKQKPLIAKCIFDLIAVTGCLICANNGFDRRQGYFADALKIVRYLLILVSQLFFIRQHLPLAAATHPEVFTKRYYPVFGIAVKKNRAPFSPVFFIFPQ